MHAQRTCAFSPELATFVQERISRMNSETDGERENIEPFYSEA